MSDYNAEQAELFGAETELVQQNILDFISAGQLVPSRDWITAEISAKPPGTHKVVALLRGRAWGHGITPTQFGEMIKLEGEFEAESHVTGEVSIAPVAYLPKKWGKLCIGSIDQLPRDAAGTVESGASVTMLLTIGCRATGKAIPYAWTIATHLDRGASPEMKRLRKLSTPLYGRLDGPRVAGALSGREPRTIDAETDAIA